MSDIARFEYLRDLERNSLAYKSVKGRLLLLSNADFPFVQLLQLAPSVVVCPHKNSGANNSLPAMILELCEFNNRHSYKNLWKLNKSADVSGLLSLIAII